MSMSAGQVSMSGLVRSEWTKLCTVRSSMWALGMTAFVGVATSAIAMGVTRARWATEPLANKAAFNPVETSLMGAYVGGALLLGVLGILVVSGEYATGTIRATLAAAPRRPMVLAAKVLVFGTVSLLVAQAVAFAGFLVGQVFLSSSPAPHATLSSPGALRAVAGTGIFLCLVGLLALGLAVVIRTTAGAISAYVALLLVLPIILEAVPDPLQYQVERLLPMDIGSAMIDDPVRHAFGPWVGLVILCGYTLLVLAIGTLVLVRRDA